MKQVIKIRVQTEYLVAYLYHFFYKRKSKVCHIRAEDGKMKKLSLDYKVIEKNVTFIGITTMFLHFQVPWIWNRVH